MNAARSGPAWPEIAVGLGVAALGAVVVGDTMLAPAGPSYGQVGPSAFPYGGGFVLLLLGVLLVLAGFRGGWRSPESEAELGRPNWRGLLWVCAGLFANALLIGWLGFVLASTILFACVARGFDSRRPLRDAAIGFALALVSYLGFAKLLSIKLGEGLLERLL